MAPDNAHSVDAELVLRPSDLLVWFDETGSETLSDPKYPIFGLGGCAINGENYIRELDAPWRQLKEQHFGGASKPLHAAKIDLTNTAGIRAIGEFFRQCSFARFATVITSKTDIKPSGTSAYLAISLAVIDQLEKLVLSSAFHRFVFIVEASHRGNPLVREHFSEFWPILDFPSGPGRAPVERCFMSKASTNSGLEIADFVMHAAGGQSSARLRQRTSIRKDFQSIFAPAPNRFTHFQLIEDTIEVRRKPGA